MSDCLSAAISIRREKHKSRYDMLRYVVRTSRSPESTFQNPFWKKAKRSHVWTIKRLWGGSVLESSAGSLLSKRAIVIILHAVIGHQ